MDKSDSATSATPAETDISIQQGDWSAYRHHINSHANGSDQRLVAGDDNEDDIGPLLAHSTLDSSGQPLTSEDDIIAYRRQCARAYIGKR